MSGEDRGQWQNRKLCAEGGRVTALETSLLLVFGAVWLFLYIILCFVPNFYSLVVVLEFFQS
jgi:hypothetical protein